MSSLQKFLDAQAQTYPQALNEISNGRKQSHWMWFIFPQVQGLGHSPTAVRYAIEDLDEAGRYLAHPVLGKNLVKISEQLMRLNGLSAHDIFGSPDDVKLRSSMTLFANVPDADPVFGNVITKYFNGQPDVRTLDILSPGR